MLFDRDLSLRNWLNTTPQFNGDERSLLKNILEDTTDHHSYGMYADYLTEQGDRSAYFPRLMSTCSIFTTDSRSLKSVRLTSNGEFEYDEKFKVYFLSGFPARDTYTCDCKYFNMYFPNTELTFQQADHYTIMYLIVLSKNFLLFQNDITFEQIQDFHWPWELMHFEQWCLENSRNETSYELYIKKNKRLPLHFQQVRVWL